MLIMVLFYCQNITQGWYTAMLTNTKILIADEDLRSRRSIKDALVKNGYRFVEEAENGEEAILLINRIHPDVVIADVWLSKLDGVSLGSDAFFPFGDNIERARRSGVRYIAQPGGSIRDDQVIETCNQYQMAMCFTGIRLFHH